MTNYEIMLVVNGTMAQKDATAVSANCQKLLKGVKDLKVTDLGLKKMAYKIKGINQAYYYVFDFQNDNPEIIKEFNRLTLINKDVLRFLIINLEHNYGWKALHNAKKVERSKTKAKIYEQKKKEYEAKIAAKKAAEAVEAKVENKLVDTVVPEEKPKKVAKKAKKDNE